MSEPRSVGLRNYESRATANASVVTARNRPLMRSAGSPTTRAATAPAAPAASRAKNRSTLVLDEVAGDDRADADEGELAEADVAAPAGEDDERHRRPWRVAMASTPRYWFDELHVDGTHTNRTMTTAISAALGAAHLGQAAERSRASA